MHLSDLNPLDYSVWDILQELVYEGGMNRLQTSKTFRMLSETNGMMSMIRQREKLVEKAFSSSGKTEWRTYSAHFLQISGLMITATFWCSLRIYS